jgi:acyl-CoA reductase-like NAD-dependent aldehyde dehydrogenase
MFVLAKDMTDSLPNNTGLFINGEFRPAKSGATFDVFDPRDDSKLTTVAKADAADVDAAVAAARAALPVWAAVPALEKTRLINRLADLIEANAESLAVLESLNSGKPVSDSKGEIPCALQTYRYFAGFTDKVTGDVHVPGDGGSADWLKYTQLVPVGVVGHLVPWNYPIVELAKYIAPCLAAGAVSVYKTNEWTPLTVIKTMELFAQAGFPPGVVNVVHGGVDVGEMITRHMRIDKVIFTGSVRAGRQISIAAAESNLKQVCLELGGKSANIICPDVDLDAVAPNVLMCK